MALDLASLTELDAVNVILSSIGDSPVNGLADNGLANAALARQELHNMSRRVQALGWQFNFEENVLLERDNNGHINLGSNVLRVKTSKRDVTQRGLRLYDKEKRTFVFDQDLRGDRVLFLPWDDLPAAAREYIAIAASRKFQTSFIGSAELKAITEEDEFKALVSLKDAEGENLSADFLSGIHPFSMLTRRRVL